MDRDTFIENFLGGIFAIVAVIAAVIEMMLVGVSADTLVACVKDVFGTLAVVCLFFAIVKDKIPSSDFRKIFDAEMETVCNKYGLLIRKEEVSASENATSFYKDNKARKLERTICYEMADNINVLFDVPCNNYKRFLEVEITDTTKVKLLIRKTFFDCPGFSEETLQKVTHNIHTNLKNQYKKCERYEKKNEIVIDLERQSKNRKDAKDLAAAVDHIIMLYIAESKK